MRIAILIYQLVVLTIGFRILIRNFIPGTLQEKNIDRDP